MVMSARYMGMRVRVMMMSTWVMRMIVRMMMYVAHVGIACRVSRAWGRT